MTEPPYSVLHLHGADIPGEEQGQFRHRIINAISLLSPCGEIVASDRNWFAPNAFEDALSADLLIVHDLVSSEITKLMRSRRAEDRPTLFEIADNPLTPRPWGRRNQSISRKHIAFGLITNASLADGLQFSSQGLLAKFGHLNPCSIVLDNVVDFPSTPPEKSDGFIFGWAGTRSHLDDLAAIAPAVINVCRLRPEAVFALMGDEAFVGLFTDLPGHQLRYQPFADYDAYRAFLVELHVGLGPLRRCAFNDGRSDIKAIEIIAAGGAALVSDAPVYTALGDVVGRFSDADDLLQKLLALHDNPLARMKNVARAFRILAERRGWRVIADQHSGWYRRWLVGTAGRTRRGEDPCRCGEKAS